MALADPLGLRAEPSRDVAVQRSVADDAIDAPKEDSITEDRATIQDESAALSPRQLAKAQRRNPHWADKLGFRAGDFGSSAPLNSPEFANDVARAQRDNGLAVDGIAGPRTHRALATGGGQLEDGVLGPDDELESGVLGPDDELESGVLGADDERLESGLIGMDDPMFTGGGALAGSSETLEPGVLGVQGKAMDVQGQDAASVQQIAARGVVSSGGPLPHLDRIQASFGGHDVGGVHAHVGGQAADAAGEVGAVAYATGNDVAFSQSPDLHTAAHEAAHVVQQRAGVQLKGGVGEVGDRYEQQADAVADLVVQGKSAEETLGPVRTTGSSGGVQAHTVQRFGSKEHRLLGDHATTRKKGGGRTFLTIGSLGYKISYGEIVALAADFFSSIEQMEKLANKKGPGPDTQEALDYARYVEVGRPSSHWQDTPKQDDENEMVVQAGAKDKRFDSSSYSPETIKAVKARYYKLAGQNAKHFVHPNQGEAGKPDHEEFDSAGSNYRENHEKAIRRAVSNARSGKSVDSALATEAFGDHFLTDACSAGHMRVPRNDVLAWWNARDPGLESKFGGYFTWRVAEWIMAHGKAGGVGVGRVPNIGSTVVGTVRGQLKAALDGKPSLTMGQFVSLALHDYDNKFGVHVLVEGEEKIMYGDGHLAEGDTKHVAQRAVRIGAEEVVRAYRMAKSNADIDAAAICQTLKGGSDEYGAECALPKLNPAKAQEKPMPRWAVETVAELFADPLMSIGFTEAIEGNISEIRAIAESLAEPGKSGILKGFVEPVVADPIGQLKKILAYNGAGEEAIINRVIMQLGDYPF